MCYNLDIKFLEELMMKLLNYSEKHAKSIAKMWNESAESWGGIRTVETEKSILDKEENSAFLNLTLAEENDEIIGYCKLLIDPHDEDALSIDLLNVRPDYHGKSVGKKLLLDSIDKTIERGWRRLDLFTWAGNTKAVPLYKKCGFFWEKRDNTTHLINLIPDVLSCELVEDFFVDVDWYKDSTREIIQEPDSRIFNGFDLWNYSWEKDGKSLNMEYSRRGRGLRKIESDDYIIEVNVEKRKLVFGNDYNVTYNFINKTQNDLEISITGCDDRNIKFEYDTSFILKDKHRLDATFFVAPIAKEQKEHLTHPVVKSIISVNGKSATFMTGIEPVYPLSMNLKHNTISNVDKLSNAYLNIQNDCNTKATFEFELQSNQDIEFGTSSFSFFLEKDEKTSLEVPYYLNNATFYNEKVKIKVKREGYDDFEFEKSISSIFQGSFGKFSGENENYAIICNGKNRVYFNKINNSIAIDDMYRHKGHEFSGLKLGMPFTQEFEKKKTDSIEFTEDNDWIKISLNYTSDLMTGISFTRNLILHGNGIVRMWYDIANSSEKRNISLSEELDFSINGFVAPYDHKYITFENETNFEFGHLKASRLSENWLFSKSDGHTFSIIWPEDIKLIFTSEEVVLEFEKVLETGETYSTQMMHTSLNSFKDWREVKYNALGESSDNDHLSFSNEIQINAGNPFIAKEFGAVYIDHKSMDAVGKISSNNHTEELINNTATITSRVTENTQTLDLVQLVGSDEKRYNRVVFKTEGKIEHNLTKESNLEVYQIDNGILQFKCAPGFSNAIYSLRHQNLEWLTTSFPKAKPFAWWRCWTGGIISRPMDIDLATIIDEKITCKQITKVDSLNNEWSGLEITTQIIQNEKNKGVEWRQYVLTLPGVPVLAYYVSYKQNDKTYTHRKRFVTETFYDITDESHFEFLNSNDNLQKVYSGEYDIEYVCPSNHSFHNNKSSYSLYRYANLDLSRRGIFNEVNMTGSWGIDYLSAKGQETEHTQPEFIIFSKEKLKGDWLRDLRNIKF